MCLFPNFSFSHRSHAVSTQRTNNGVAHCSAGVRWNFCREKHQILIAHGTDIPGCSLEDALVPHCPLSLSLNAPSSSPSTPEYLRFRDPLARPSWLWQVYLKKVLPNDDLAAEEQSPESTSRLLLLCQVDFRRDSGGKARVEGEMQVVWWCGRPAVQGTLE